MKHPDSAIQREQQQQLAALSGQRRKQLAQQFRLTNAFTNYFGDMATIPTVEDYQDWLEGLPVHIRAIMAGEGFVRNQRSLALRWHAAERNDAGLDAYLENHLSPLDYAFWVLLNTRRFNHAS